MLMVTGVSATVVGTVWHRALVHGSRVGGRDYVGHSSSGLRQTAAGTRSLAHSSEKYRSSASQVLSPKALQPPIQCQQLGKKCSKQKPEGGILDSNQDRDNYSTPHSL